MNGSLSALDYIENQITESGLQQMQGGGENYSGDMMSGDSEIIM